MVYAGVFHLRWFQYLLLLTPLVSPVFTALILPGNAISPTTTRDDPQNSPTLEAAVPNISLQCVSPAAEPDWAGPIDATDCQIALRLMRQEVSRYGAQMFSFWSREFGPSGPASRYWLLPFAKTSGKSLCPSSSNSYFGDQTNVSSQAVASPYFASQRISETMYYLWPMVDTSKQALGAPRLKNDGTGCCFRSNRSSNAFKERGNRAGRRAQMRAAFFYYFRRRVQWQGSGRPML